MPLAKPSSALEAMYQDILREPSDETLKLIYADMQTDSGNDNFASLLRRKEEVLWRLTQQDRARLYSDRPFKITVTFDSGQRLDFSLPCYFDEIRIVRGMISGVSLPYFVWETHGPELVSLHPITRVRPTDRHPNVWGWYRRSSDGFQTYPNVPWFVWGEDVHRCLEAYPGAILTSDGWVDFPSEEISYDALSYALVTTAREKAQLPPLPLIPSNNSGS